MKRLLSLSAAILLAQLSFAQESLHIDSLYENRSELILNSDVIELDSLKVGEIHNRIKNWAGRNFVNMGEVLVSETDNQLVFNYITSVYVKSMGIPVELKYYVRLTFFIKDGKTKVVIQDDGNVMVANSAGVTPARSYYMYDYFRKGDVIQNKGMSKAGYQFCTEMKSRSESQISELRLDLKKGGSSTASSNFDF